MKKIALSIFLLSTFALVGVISFLALQNKNKDGVASGDNPPINSKPKIEVFVDEKVEMIQGQTKQLYLTVRPQNAVVEINFSKAGLIEIDKDFVLFAKAEGNLICEIKVSYLQEVTTKNVEIEINKKQITFSIDNQICFSGESYLMKIESNFYLDKSDIETCNNIVINKVVQKNTKNNFVNEVSFNVLSNNYFHFYIDEFTYQNLAIERPVFETGFYETSVFDSSSNLITLYSNISNQNIASENNFYEYATFIQDLTDFNVKVEDKNIVEIKNNKVVAINSGITKLEVFSSVDSSFYKKFNIIVKEISLQSFDVYLDGNLLKENVETKLEIGQETVFEIKNIMPSFAKFDIVTNIETDDNIIVFDSAKNLIVANNLGESVLKVEINSVKKEFSFLVFEQQNNPEQPIFSIKVNGSQISLIAESNKDNIVKLSGQSFTGFFQISVQFNNQSLSFEEVEMHIKTTLQKGGYCILRGSILDLEIYENLTLIFAHNGYEIVLNFVLEN